MIWCLDQNDEGLYFLDHPRKGSLKDMTINDLELLASMFADEVVEADKLDFYEDEDLIEE